MYMHSPPAAGWATKISYLCAGIFSAAAIGTNAVYGFGRGENLASSLIWSAVAIAVSTAATLAWPACQRAFQNKDWPAAVMSAVAGALFLAFSIAGALGAASSGRTIAATIETDAAGARKRAQTAYDTAQAELARLEPSRSVEELVPLVEAAKPQCRVRVDSNGRQTVCAKPSGLLAELGRAHRRSELKAQIDRASAALSTGQAHRPANADAKAVSKYISAIGLEIGADRIADILVLLAVLVLEIGPGACLTLALTLSQPATSRTDDRSDTGRQATAAENAAPDGKSDARTTPLDRTTPVVVRPDRTPAIGVVRPDVHAWLAARGGKAVISMRRLAGEVGLSPSGLHDVVRRMVASGVLSAVPSRRGTALELLGPETRIN